MRTMQIKRICVPAALTFALLGCAPAQVHARSDAPRSGAAATSANRNKSSAPVDRGLQSQARLSADEARASALAVRAGHIKEWELEREAGGSGLRYSFVVEQHHVDFEVGVDARDGRILENQPEGDNPD